MNKNDNKLLMIVLIVVLAVVFFGGYQMMGSAGGMMHGYFGFGWLFGIIALIAAILVIYDVLVNNKKLSDGMKLLWIILAVFFSIVTAIIYYFIGRNEDNDLFRKR